MTKRCKVCENRFEAPHRRSEICPECKEKITPKPRPRKPSQERYIPELEVSDLEDFAVLSAGNPFHDP